MEKRHTLADFLLDESFYRYCFVKNELDHTYWTQYIEQYPAQKELIAQARRELEVLYQSLSELDRDEQLTKLRVQLDTNNHRKPHRGWMYAAASILLVGMAMWWLWQSPSIRQTLVGTITVASKPSERKTVQLPDGTTVKLNADSRIETRRGFNTSNREITLTGEAFLDVAQNTKLPFIIRTESFDVKVLGTILNVKAYPNESHATTSLITGSAEVVLKEEANRTVRLKPAEKVVAFHRRTLPVSDLSENPPPMSAEQHYVLDHVTFHEVEQVIAETSWTEDKLIFVNEPLESIAKTLERWYDVKIGFTSEALSKRAYSGSFNDRESLFNVLKTFQLSVPFRYIQQRDSIIITPN